MENQRDGPLQTHEFSPQSTAPVARSLPPSNSSSTSLVQDPHTSRRRQKVHVSVQFLDDFENVFSNQSYQNYQNSQRLGSYPRLVDGTRIREISLISTFPESLAEYWGIIEEVKQVLKTIQGWSTCNIKRAILHMYSFSSRWLPDFKRLASNTLVHLSVLTIVHYTNMEEAIKWILSSFPHLTFLYFGTKCRSVAYYEERRTENETFMERYSRISTRDDIVGKRRSTPSVQHQNLIELRLESDECYEIGWLERAVFPSLPKLEVLDLRGEIYSSDYEVFDGDYQHFYHTLLRCCPSIRLFSYHHRSSEDYRHHIVLQDLDETDEEESILNHYFVQQDGGIKRKFFYSSRCDTKLRMEPLLSDHFRGVMINFCGSLREMNLTLLYYYLLNFASSLRFPQLEILTLTLNHRRSRTMMCNNPYYCLRPGVTWIPLLQQMPRLRLLSLTGVTPNFGSGDALYATLPRLELLKLHWRDEFYGTTHHQVVDMAMVRRSKRHPQSDTTAHQDKA